MKIGFSGQIGHLLLEARALSCVPSAHFHPRVQPWPALPVTLSKTLQPGGGEPWWVKEGRRQDGLEEKQAGGQRGEGGMELSQLGPWMRGAQTEAGAGVSGPRRAGYRASGRAAPAPLRQALTVVPGSQDGLRAALWLEGAGSPEVPRAPGRSCPRGVDGVTELTREGWYSHHPLGVSQLPACVWRLHGELDLLRVWKLLRGDHVHCQPAPALLSASFTPSGDGKHLLQGLLFEDLSCSVKFSHR